ncbi:hypothetical protein Hanom_Chr13g01190141 [Helianthus anomalus]
MLNSSNIQPCVTLEGFLFHADYRTTHDPQPATHEQTRIKPTEDRVNQRPTMSEVVKELESIMELIGLNPCIESSSPTSASYEGTSKDYNYPDSTDSLLSYSEGSLPSKLYQE